jgi:WD40 repeat protein
VLCLAVLPDGRVVSGSGDESLRVWDAATGTCKRVLEGHTEGVSCLAVLPDGRVVSGSDDKSLRVWDAATGACKRVLEGHTKGLSCLAVLPDGRVVSGSDDKCLRVWDAATGKCERVLKGHTSYVLCLAVLPDGRVVSGSGDKILRVWDAATGVCERIVRHSDADFASLDPSGRTRWSVGVASLGLGHQGPQLSTNLARIHAGQTLTETNAVVRDAAILVCGGAEGMVMFSTSIARIVV